MNHSSPSSDNYHEDHVRMMLASYRQHTWRDLFRHDPAIFQWLWEQVWNAPFVLVSQWAEEDPILNYANKAWLNRFEYPWSVLTRTPWRLTAEPENQEDRERLLRDVRERGYSLDYSGIRITGTRKRFQIVWAAVWTILDDQDNYRWLAASFSKWTDLPGK